SQTYAQVEPFAQLGGANAGKWVYVEMLLTGQSSSSTSDGVYDLWYTDAATLTAIGHYNQTGVNYVKGTGQNLVPGGIFFAPTYGGGSNSPPAGGVFWEVDEFFVGVK